MFNLDRYDKSFLGDDYQQSLVEDSNSNQVESKSSSKQIVDDSDSEYTRCDLKDINSIVLGSFVKYARIDGKEVKGGYLEKVMANKEGVLCLYFTYPPTSRWIVKITSITELWVKGKSNHVDDVIHSEVSGYDKLEKIQNSQTDIRIGILEAEIRSLNNKLKQLVKLVLEIHVNIEEKK